jgi:23S rRNA pseudouridine2605 synthase
MNEKLQKVLARIGLGSRREIEEWIRLGRVKVNQRVAEIGYRTSPKDVIHVDDQRIYLPQENIRYKMLVYNKPLGEICTRYDDEGRPTTFNALPNLKNGRWISVGRLDINSSGLLLFTNDGELAHRLMHPSSEIEREYLVRVFGKVGDDHLQQLKKGVQLEDGSANFERIIDVGGEGLNHWYQVVVKEGKNRLVRRLWDALGFTVNRLVRIRYGAVRLEKNLRSGQWRELSEHEIAKLKQLIRKTEK